MKTVYLIHRWDGNLESDWYPWLKTELEKLGHLVYILEMPNPEKPNIKKWVQILKKEIKNPNEETCLIGHSIGCQAILRYLETLDEHTKVGKIILVAGWLTLTGLETEEERTIAKPWLEDKISLESAKEHTGQIIAIFSDNDPYVPLENAIIFEKELNAEIIIENNMGHFTEADGTKELPVILEKI